MATMDWSASRRRNNQRLSPSAAIPTTDVAKANTTIPGVSSRDTGVLLNVVNSTAGMATWNTSLPSTNAAPQFQAEEAIAGLDDRPGLGEGALEVALLTGNHRQESDFQHVIHRRQDRMSEASTALAPNAARLSITGLASLRDTIARTAT